MDFTQITGKVVGSGLGPASNTSEEWRRKEAEEKSKNYLPMKDTELILVLHDWDSKFCKAKVRKIKRFFITILAIQFLLLVAACHHTH